MPQLSPEKESPIQVARRREQERAERRRARWAKFESIQKIIKVPLALIAFPLKTASKATRYPVERFPETTQKIGDAVNSLILAISGAAGLAFVNGYVYLAIKEGAVDPNEIPSLLGFCMLPGALALGVDGYVLYRLVGKRLIDRFGANEDAFFSSAYAETMSEDEMNR